jgi:hypothetical protein
VALVALVAAAGCSSDPPEEESRNLARWKPGNAVVVLVADVRAGMSPDVADLGERPGVIAAWTKGSTLRLSFGRQAKLVDLAALQLELERTAGLSNVRQVVVAPSGSPLS